MTKYVLVSWPEIQNYMTHERWGECILCQSINEHYCQDGSWMVPEDLYNEVTYKLEFPKKYEDTNLGTIVCYETKAVVNGEDTYWYDEDNVKKGDIVLIYDHYNKKWHTSKVIACTEDFPILLDDPEFVIGINCEFIGHRDPNIPF